LRELVELLAKSLVEHPEQVQVSVHEDGDMITCEVRVAPDDVGKIIGKQGRIVKAIRVVAKAAGAKEGKKVMVEVPG